MISVSCLIPAAGLGQRFRESKKGLPPKLDLPLGGKKLLEKTLAPFLESPYVKEIILAVPRGSKFTFKKRLENSASKTIKIVEGGLRRTDSVYEALRHVNPKISWVIVHDGARPLLDKGMLSAFLKDLPKKKALIVARPVAPTLKLAKARSIQKTVPRRDMWEAETPQGFSKAGLKKAYQNYFKKPFEATDEASLLEAAGEKVFLFKNEKPNLKITTFSDYKIAKRISGDLSLVKAGIGFDIHRLEPGRPCYLGGIRIPFRKGPLGHSDGDPVLHALSDAMLGALALGDIGEHFPDSSSKTRGMRSTKILKKVADLVKEKGYELAHADLNVILEKPKLGSYKIKMREKMASILNVPLKRISLKARTAEGLGDIGRGEAVSSQAIVTLKELD